MKRKNENHEVAAIAELLALRRGYSPEAARQIRIAALLHDIGKQQIPAHILQKPGKLTTRERAVIKTHTTIGADMLAGVGGEIGVVIRNVCLLHHEWDNGGGYWKKPPEELPAYVPLVAIADVYVALINDRPYKSAWTRDAALGYLREQAGTQFSQELVKDFHALIAATSSQLGQK